MAKVAILISTYNGMRYLSEQLDSLIGQEGVIVTVFVRDDGSTDDTKEMLTSYAEKHDNIKVSFENNVGVGNAFLKMIYDAPSDYDYYALSDQDDVWEPDKVVSAVNFLEKTGGMLYASNQECVDAECNSLGLRYDEHSRINLTPEGILSENNLAGCTMVFNNKFYSIITEEGRRPSSELLKVRIHDVWLAMVASLYGGLVYDPSSHIKYRQHGDNIVGAYRKPLKDRIKAKFKKIKNKSLRCYRSALAKEIILKFPEKAAEHPLIGISANCKTLKGKNSILKNAATFRAFTGESGLTFFFKVVFNLF